MENSVAANDGASEADHAAKLICSENTPATAPVRAVDIAHSLTFDDVLDLTGGRLGTHDAPCPACGPGRHAPANRRRPVLRVWYTEPAFATYNCARCGLHGHVRTNGARRINPWQRERLKFEAAKRKAERDQSQRNKAIWLWRHHGRHPAPSSNDTL